MEHQRLAYLRAVRGQFLGVRWVADLHSGNFWSEFERLRGNQHAGARNGGGGTYIHFFRTSGGTVQAGSGSYVSAEIVVPGGFTSPGAATLNINKVEKREQSY